MILTYHRKARIAMLIGLVVLAFVLPTAYLLATRVERSPRPRFTSLSYGIQTFLWWNTFTRSRDLERVRQMRFGIVKQIVDWGDVRPDKNRAYNWQRMDDVVNETIYRKLKFVARLGNQPPYWALLPKDSDPNQPPFDSVAFGEFCHDVATRYKGKINAYQVWNEPNL